MKFIDKIAQMENSSGEEFAPGIPEKGAKSSLPSGKDERWKINIQEHSAKRSGRHIDLRLNPPSSSIAYSWALPSGWPGPNQKKLAVHVDDHHKHYLGFEGEIEEGYGAGMVSSKLLDTAHILESKPDKILFNIYRGADVERYMLKQLQGDEWLLYNYSHTNKNQDIPDYKPKAKSIDFNQLRTDFEDEVFAPKADGAHTTTHLRPGKIIDTFSYRLSKKSPKRIDHTFRTDLYKYRAPKELGNTVVRTELFLPGERGNEVAGILNSNVWKARRKQKDKDKKLHPLLIDVVKFKGENVENRPYREKLKMMKEISDKVPPLEMPPLYFSKKEKKQLVKSLREGTNPLTEEGLMIYKLDEPAPYKSKKTEDFDMLITGIYPARRGSKYHGTHIGGFVGQVEGSGPEIRVGTGLDDQTRRDAFKSPEDYIGQWAKVQAQHMHSSGTLQAPSFKGLRSDKYPNKDLQAQAQSSSTKELLSKHAGITRTLLAMEPDEREKKIKEILKRFNLSSLHKKANKWRQLIKEAKIKQENGKYILYTKDGKRVLGRHDTYEKALAQERAIWASRR